MYLYMGFQMSYCDELTARVQVQTHHTLACFYKTLIKKCQSEVGIFKLLSFQKHICLLCLSSLKVLAMYFQYVAITILQ